MNPHSTPHPDPLALSLPLTLPLPLILTLTGGYSEDAIKKEKVLQIMQDDELSDTEKMEKSMRVVGHTGYVHTLTEVMDDGTGHVHAGIEDWG